MKYAACVVPAAPVYREATYKSELINQLLFGETVEILDAGDKFWVKVKGFLDGYEGWAARGQLEEIHKRYTPSRAAPMVKQPFTLLKVGGKSMIIPFGASLLGLGFGGGMKRVTSVNPSGEVTSETIAVNYMNYLQSMTKGVLSDTSGCIGNFNYTYKESLEKALFAKTPDVRTLTDAWLDAPYLWGGRTMMGVDCSGFAQTICKVMGIPIARDAHQQALQGEVVGFLQEAEPGDLAFFDDEEGKIIHVGILLNEHEIVHAAGGTGKVQIDKIDNEGIVRSDNGVRTHRLRIIKRYKRKSWTKVLR